MIPLYLSRAVWRKSTRSNGSGACVEVAHASGVVAVRDSKNPGGGALLLRGAGWDAFRNAVKSGAFDL